MADLKKLYDEVIMDHIKHARNYGEMPEATAQAEGVNALCGDNLTVYVKVEDDVVRNAGFKCECCGISMASASIMTELVAGKSVSEARHIAAELLESFSEEQRQMVQNQEGQLRQVREQFRRTLTQEQRQMLRDRVRQTRENRDQGEMGNRYGFGGNGERPGRGGNGNGRNGNGGN